MFQKNFVYYHQSSAQSKLKLFRPTKHWGFGGRKTFGEAVEAEGRQWVWGLGREL